MGFSGGGSNVLLPHTHDGRVAQDGGPLDFNNITQSQSTAGEIFYSDGTALQQLSPGVAGDALQVNGAATAPEWVTPSAAAGWTQLADVVLTVGGLLATPTFAAMDSLYVQIYAAQDASTNQTLSFNSDLAANYNWRSEGNAGGQATRSGVANGIIYLYNIASSTNWALAQMFMSNHATTKKLITISTTESGGVGNVVPNQEFCSGSWNETTDAITSIQWGDDNGYTNALAGSYIKVYGC